MLKNEKITITDLIALAVGSIIGWGAFILPGDLFLSNIGFINSILGLFIGGIIVCIIERNYSYLIKKIPLSGGEFLFTKKILGKNNSFVCGWFLSLAYICIVPLNATAVALIFNILTKGKYMYIYLYKIGNYSVYFSDILITSIFIILLGYLNIKGIKIASYFQKIMVFLLVGIVIYFFVMIIMKDGVITKNIKSHTLGIQFKFSGVFKVVAICPWAYVGFDCITQILEELNMSNKTISKISIGSLFIGCMLYILILIFTAYGISYQELLNGHINWATGEAIERYFGTIGIYLLAVALIAAVICGVNGFYLNASRLISIMAKEGQLPKFLNKKNRNKIPINAILSVMFLSLLAPWLGRQVLILVVDMSSVGIAIAYFYVSLSTLKLYYLEEKKVKVTAILGLLASIFFIILLIFPILESSLKIESIYMLIFWGMSGSIYYFYKCKKAGDKSVYF